MTALSYIPNIAYSKSTMRKSHLKKRIYFIPTLLIIISEYIRNTYICFVSNYFFKYYTLSTYTSKNILSIIGIILIVSLGPVEHMQVF
jgi:hypothetical protein